MKNSPLYINRKRLGIGTSGMFRQLSIYQAHASGARPRQHFRRNTNDSPISATYRSEVGTVGRNCAINVDMTWFVGVVYGGKLALVYIMYVIGSN